MSMKNNTTYSVVSIGADFRYKGYKYTSAGWRAIEHIVECGPLEVVVQEVKPYGRYLVFDHTDMHAAIIAGTMQNVTTTRPKTKL